MKKIGFLILLIVFFFPIFVLAEEYQVYDLIPINTSATVKMEKFNYIDFSYNSSNETVFFGNIQNNTISKTAISINLLLFDQNKQNIGFVTYCTDKDVGSDSYGFKLDGNQSVSFSIPVISRYFVSGKGNSDVQYIAVMDENKYCHNGGNDQYSGLTVEEIIKQGQPEDNFIQKVFHFIQQKNLERVIFFVFIALAALGISGIIFNTLHHKMYGGATALAYLPVADFYVCVKMAFGKIIATIFFIALLVSGFLYYLKISFPLILMGVFVAVSFVIVLFKLITKKHDWFLFEPSLKPNHSKDLSLQKLEKEKKAPRKKKEKKKEEKPKEIVVNGEVEPILDLSYSDVDVSNAPVHNETSIVDFSQNQGEPMPVNSNSFGSVDVPPPVSINSLSSPMNSDLNSNVADKPLDLNYEAIPEIAIPSIPEETTPPPHKREDDSSDMVDVDLTLDDEDDDDINDFDSD